MNEINKISVQSPNKLCADFEQPLNILLLDGYFKPLKLMFNQCGF